MNKTKGKLIFAVVSLVIALTLATSTTFAWFTTNSRVSTGNVNMSIAVNGDLFLTTNDNTDFDDFTGTAGGNWAVNEDLLDLTQKLAPITIGAIAANTAVPTFKTVAGNVVDPSGNSTSLADEIEKVFYTETIKFAATSVYDIFLCAANFSVVDPTADSKKSSKYPHDLLTFPATDNAAAMAIAIKDVVYTAPTEDVTTASLAISGTANGVAFDTTTDTTTVDNLTVAEDGTVAANFSVSSKTFTITYTVADNTYAFSNVTGGAIHEKGTTVTDKNADYAMRVAFLISTFDANGNPLEAKQLVIYDPNTGMGWSAYGEYDADGNCTGYNLAHEIYDATMRVPLDGDEKKVVKTPENSVTMLGDATNRPMQLARLVSQGNSTAEGFTDLEVFGAEITIYAWLEGTDADCIDAIAGYNLEYSLEFVGELVPPSPTTNP